MSLKMCFLEQVSTKIGLILYSLGIPPTTLRKSSSLCQCNLVPYNKKRGKKLSLKQHILQLELKVNCVRYIH